MDFNNYLTENARLVILKELTRQPGGTLNQTLLLKVLDTFGHRRSGVWLRTQMRVLADVGAISITEAGTVLIAKIRQAGRDHVEGRIVLDGVETPSEV